MALQGLSAVGNPLTTRTREPLTLNLQDCAVQTSSRKQLTFITKSLLTCKKKKTRKWGSRWRGVEHALFFPSGAFVGDGPALVEYRWPRVTSVYDWQWEKEKMVTLKIEVTPGCYYAVGNLKNVLFSSSHKCKRRGGRIPSLRLAHRHSWGRA